MKSDRSFRDFLAGGKLSAFLPLLLFGVALLLLPTVFGGGEGEAEREVTGEERLSELCAAVEGVGECRVMVTYEGESVYAVAVLCEGAESVAVKERVVELIGSLYGIGSNRIAVIELDKSKQ